MEVRRRWIRDWMWIALGLGAASVMLIPQLAIYVATQLIVVGLLSLITAWLLIRSSARAAALFLGVLLLYGFVVELPGYELPPLVFFLFAGWIGVYAIRTACAKRNWNLYLSAAPGVLAGCVVVMIGFMAHSMLRDKGMGALALLRYGWSHSWRLMIAMLTGTFAACFLSTRKR